MVRAFDSEKLSRLRNEAGRLAAQAGDLERSLERLVGTEEAHSHHAEAALSQPRDVSQASLAYLVAALEAQARRTVEAAYTIRQLCILAREQGLLAKSVAAELDGDFAYVGPEEPAQEAPSRNAVLVADDYDDTRELVSLVLHQAGFTVRTAANGLEAVIAAYEMRPAVIIMDLTMPMLDGVQATRVIKAIDATRDARVIAYTARPTSTDSVYHTLFSAVLQKPASPDAVVAAVQRYMRSA
ncbi:hypothetical protein BH24ACI4_BH24ACI4_27940 [soil metagenome]